MNKSGWWSLRYVALIAVGIFFTVASVSTASAQSEALTGESSAPKWVASWSAPPMAHGSSFGASGSFDNQTLRQIVPISVGGSRVRIKLSNEYGVDAELVCTQAAARKIEVMPLSAYYYGGGRSDNALLLGFGACRPAAIRAGMWQLAAAIDAARNSLKR